MADSLMNGKEGIVEYVLASLDNGDADLRNVIRARPRGREQLFLQGFACIDDSDHHSLSLRQSSL